ncbi:hypothetical protein DL96DRAFT_277031 [Flagelloscypha sp. PMI_526]|nr:hypothetical protein DL96DRAFT_277031 [Flagelloscypha sp. PMI_526]
MKTKRACSKTVYSQLQPELPCELWQRIAKYWSYRELQDASFLHPTLSQIHEGIKYKELRVDLSFPGCYSNTSAAKLSDERLAYYLATNNSRHVQTLHINSPQQPSNLVHTLLPRPLSKFLLNKTSPKPSSNLLHGFENIRTLYLDCFLMGVAPFKLDISRHPFTTMVWNHFGTSLTQLHIKHSWEGCRVLPSEGTFPGPLPCLHTFTLDLSSQFWVHLMGDDEQTAAFSTIRLIASLYIGSNTLKNLSLADGALTPIILSLLLPPLGSPFPLLERFCVKLALDGARPECDTEIVPFLSAHAHTLKSLYIALPQDRFLVSRWLGALTTAPIHCSTEVTQQTDVFTTLTLNLINSLDWFALPLDSAFHPTHIIAKTLHSLSLGIFQFNLATTLSRLAKMAPCLRNLHLHLDEFSMYHVILIAGNFPALDSLCLGWYNFFGRHEIDVSDLVDDLPQNIDVFSGWKVNDLSLIWKPRMCDRETQILCSLSRLFAQHIPSIRSFYGSGDILSSEYSGRCSCRAREEEMGIGF